MIKCVAVRNFNLEKFDELKNLVRHNSNKKEEGKIYEKDVFECSSDMASYLGGNNPDKITVIRIIEVLPDEVKPKKEEVNKTTTKTVKTTKNKKNK